MLGTLLRISFRTLCLSFKTSSSPRASGGCCCFWSWKQKAIFSKNFAITIEPSKPIKRCSATVKSGNSRNHLCKQLTKLDFATDRCEFTGQPRTTIRKNFSMHGTKGTKRTNCSATTSWPRSIITWENSKKWRLLMTALWKASQKQIKVKQRSLQLSNSELNDLHLMCFKAIDEVFKSGTKRQCPIFPSRRVVSPCPHRNLLTWPRFRVSWLIS